VGIIEDPPQDTAIASANSIATVNPAPKQENNAGGDPEQVLIVVGRQLSNWRGGDTFDWPLDMPLDEFFADTGAPDPSHDGAMKVPNPTAHGTPPSRYGDASNPQHDTDWQYSVRAVDSTGSAGKRLLNLFEKAPRSHGELTPVVVRDDSDDYYLVSLQSATCATIADHHTDMGCFAVVFK